MRLKDTLSTSSNMDRNLEELKLLFDYTKWQSRFCLIIATVGAAAVASTEYNIDARHGPMWVAIILSIVAGFSAGVVVSGIPGFHGTIDEYWDKRLGPIWHFMPAKYWYYLQHGALYAAMVFVGIGMILGRQK